MGYKPRSKQEAYNDVILDMEWVDDIPKSQEKLQKEGVRAFLEETYPHGVGFMGKSAKRINSEYNGRKYGVRVLAKLVGIEYDSIIDA